MIRIYIRVHDSRLIPKTTIMKLGKCYFRSKIDKNPKRILNPNIKHNHNLEKQEDSSEQSPGFYFKHSQN